MARTGFKVTVYLDDNPSSSGYMQTYEERVEDTSTCPISEDNWILISSDCEIGMSGYTGYRLLTYYNATSGEYMYVREEDAECEESSTEEEWVNSGSPYCETTEQGLNTGYMLQLQVQMNSNLPSYGETRYQKYKSPECGGNNCPQWELVSKQCHISVANCVATFDGTADIVEIDVNPLSESYNQTRTVNKQDSDCENCTSTSFNWVLVGDMCGDDSLLCDNGIQETSTNSYTVHRKYKTIGGASPIPMDEYQVVLKIEDDEDCGYIKPQYEMRRINGQYICDFETYTKYEKWCQYVSYDSGETWSYVVPEVCESGDVIAYDSYDCGKPMYRWIPNGEFTCVDNGDDGKIVYWDSNSVMTKSYPCNESGTLTKAEYNGMVTVTSGITSPDGYEDTYQVGDCVSILADQALSDVDKKLWLGNYTERLGNKTLCGYSRALDIPSRVNDMSHRAFGMATWNVGSRCWDVECQSTPNVMVMHPTTPPLMVNNDDFPWSMVLAPDSVSSSAANAYNGTAIFVPNESYDEYCTADVWSTHANSLKGRLLPMNNEPLTYKAVMDYESDFSKWRYLMVEGSDKTSIYKEDVYGLACVKKLKIGNQVKTIKSQAFSGCVATELDFGNGVETIENKAFIENKLTNIHIPSCVRTIGNRAFAGHYQIGTYDTIVTSITIDNGVESIGESAFEGHHISGTLEIPDSVTTIGTNAFNARGLGVSPSNVEHIIIGSGCTSIGDGAFYQRWENNEIPLKTVTIKALTPPTLGGSSDECGNSNTVFSNANNIRMPDGYYCNFAYGAYTIYVPCEAYEDYIDSPDWNFFARTAPENYGCEVTIEPYGCSGVEETIAVLHQTNGTDINITKPTEYRKKILRESDIEPYTATTSAITVNANCTKIEDITLYTGETLSEVTFNGVTPPLFQNFDNLGVTLYVPCVGFSEYYEALDESEYILPSDDSCIEESWVYESNICDYVTHYFTDIYRKYQIIDGISIRTDITSSVTTSNVCVEVEIGDFNLSQDGKTYNSQTGSVESTMYITFYGSDRNVKIQVPKNQQTGGNYGEIDIYRTDTGSFVDYTRYSKDLTLSSGIRYKIYFDGQFTNDVYAQFIMLS